MARSSTSPANRLKVLARAKERAAKLKRGEVLGAQPMAKMLEVSWPTLREWCNDIPKFAESGAFTGGGQGIDYEFKPAATIRFLTKHFAAKSAAMSKRNRSIRQAAGVDLPDDEDTASFAETKGMVDMTIAIVGAREKQGQYTPADEMAAFIEGYNQRVTAAILGVRTQVDPNGNLPTHIRAAVDDYLRGVATHVHAEAAAFIEENGAGLQQERTG